MTKNNTTIQHFPAVPGENVEFQVVTLHETDIVTWTTDTIVLNTGGWRTATTKARMNEVSSEFQLGFVVYQRKNEWFVTLPTGEDVPFHNATISFDRKF